MEFKNGLEYSLTDFFSWTVLIPDFQRPYCWGDKIYGEKKDKNIVLGFLTTLIDAFIKDKDDVVQLGKIDTYIFPSDKLNLSDGQQRITTLYLLIGYLTQQKNSPFLKHLLTSDDNEPRLKYATDENTLDFVRDLVNNFFTNNQELKVLEIKKQSWYFDENNHVPSIKSMLEALITIEKKLDETEIDKLEFSKFIAFNIKLQYYNVEKCQYGEERFIIINTTGKSNTETENVKPILLGKISQNIKYAEQWEARESWFWKNRIANEEIADYGVNDFLTWFYQIITRTEKIDLIEKSKETISKGEQAIINQLDLLNKYFDSLLHLINLLFDEEIQQVFKCFSIKNIEVKSIMDLRDTQKISHNIIHNIILPLLSFMVKISNDKDDVYIFLRRLRKNYFHLVRTDRKKDYLDWRYVLQIVENSNNINDILIYNTLEDKWFNIEEILKLKMEVHKVKLQEWEDHPCFMGDLSPLFKVSGNSIEISLLDSFFETFKSLQNNNLFKSTELRNKYYLNDLLYRGVWDYRTVAFLGVCMLNQNTDFPHLHDNFFEIWKEFNNNANNEFLILNFLNQKIKNHFFEFVFNNDKNTIENITFNTNVIEKPELIKIWLLLEVLYTKNKDLDFSNSVACFWHYPNLIKITSKINSEENDYRIGNVLLGTSYSNNRTGWVNFEKFPLMNEILKNRDNLTEDDIVSKTILYKNLLLSVFNN